MTQMIPDPTSVSRAVLIIFSLFILKFFIKASARPQRQRDTTRMANLIAQEQRASDDEGDDSFTKPPRRHSRKKQPGLKHPINATSSVADNNFFSNLPVEGGEDILEDEDYIATNSDSGLRSGSEGDEMEITNEEAHISFILLIAFTNYNILQLADSLPRKIVAEKTRLNKSRSKKRKALSGTLSATGSSKKAHVEEVEDEGEPSPQAQSSKVCHIHYHHFHFEAHILA
jgi:hypothetical protein